MDMMDAALASLGYASAEQGTQYSAAIAKEAMSIQAQDMANILDMLPQQFQVRGPQTGDIPAILKGNFFDMYA